MNAERLHTLIKTFLDADDAVKTDQYLALVSQAFFSFQQNVTNQHRAALDNAINELANGQKLLIEYLSTPNGMVAIHDLKLAPWSTDLLSEVRTIRARNTENISLANARVDEFIQRRAIFVAGLKSTLALLEEIGVESDAHEYKEIYAQFTYPREYFHNSPTGLAKALTDTDIILQTFSQVVDGRAQETAVGAITTTWPTIDLSTTLPVLQLLSESIRSVIDVVKGLNAIRQVFQGVPQGASVDPIEAQMATTLKDRFVDTEANRLITNAVNRSEADLNDLKPKLRFALEKMIDQVQGGVTVRIKANAEIDGEVTAENLALISTLVKEINSLSYPEQIGGHHLQIERPSALE